MKTLENFIELRKVKTFIVGLFMMAMTITRRPVVVLDYPADIDDFITYAKAIYQSMSSNSMFSGLAAKLATLNTLIGVLEARQTGVNASLPTATVEERNVALVDVQNALRGLKLDVQAIVNSDVDNAEVIAAAANMKIKQQGAINKQNFVAVNGAISGTVRLIAKGLRGRYANEWAMSSDGTNWIPVTPTLRADTEVTNLQRASTWDFRHRYILKDGPTDWLYFPEVVVI